MNLIQRLRASALLGSAVSLYVIQFANYILPIVTIPYLARVLTAEGYGLTAYALSFAGIFNVVLDYGFNLTATRDIAAHKHDQVRVSRIVSEVVYTKMAMLVLALAIFGLLVNTLPATRTHVDIFWVAFLGIIGSTFLPTWLFQGIEQLPRLAAVNLVFRLAQIPLMFILVADRNDVAVWLAIVSTTSFLATALAWVLAFRGHLKAIVWPGWPAIATQLRLGFSVFLSQAAVTLYTTANTFILGTMTNLTIAGYFSAAERLVRTVFSLLAPINQVLFPRASDLASQSPKAALPLIRRSLFLVGSLGLLLSGVLLLFAPNIVHIILGTGFLEATAIVQTMSFLPFLFALGAGLTLLVLLPFRLEQHLLGVYLIAGLVNIMLALLLVPHWAGVGMAAAVLAAEITVVVIQARIAVMRGIHFSREG